MFSVLRLASKQKRRSFTDAARAQIDRCRCPLSGQCFTHCRAADARHRIAFTSNHSHNLHAHLVRSVRSSFHYRLAGFRKHPTMPSPPQPLTKTARLIAACFCSSMLSVQFCVAGTDGARLVCNLEDGVAKYPNEQYRECVFCALIPI